MFELNGERYSLEEVQEAANTANLSVEDYIIKFGLTPVEEKEEIVEEKVEENILEPVEVITEEREEVVKNAFGEKGKKGFFGGYGPLGLRDAGAELVKRKGWFQGEEEEIIDEDQTETEQYKELTKHSAGSTGDFWEDLFLVPSAVKWATVDNIPLRLLGNVHGMQAMEIDIARKLDKEYADDLALGIPKQIGGGGRYDPVSVHQDQKIAYKVEGQEDEVTKESDPKLFEELKKRHENLDSRVRVVYSGTDIEPGNLGARKWIYHMKEYERLQSIRMDTGAGVGKGLKGLVHDISGGRIFDKENDKYGVYDVLGGAIQISADAYVSFGQILATRGASLVWDIAGPMYVDYNIAKANALYGDSDDPLDQLAFNEEIDIATPMMLAVPAMLMERFGFRKVKQYMLQNGFKSKGVATLMGTAQAEAITELGQFATEEVNQYIARGAPAQGIDITEAESRELVQNALIYGVKQLATEDGLEAYLSGLIGGKVLGVTGRQVNKALRNNPDGTRFINRSIQKLHEIQKAKGNTRNPDLQATYQSAMEETVQELKDYLNNNRTIAKDITAQEKTQLISLMDAKDELYRKTARLQEQADNGEITPQEWGKAKRINTNTSKKINRDLSNIREGIVTRQLETGIKEVQKTSDQLGWGKINTYETADDFTAQTGRPKNVDGFIDEAGQIYINKEVAKETGTISVAQHEFLHKLIANQWSDNTQANKLIKGFKESLSKDELALLTKRVKDNYDPKYMKENPDEWLTVYASLLKDGDIQGDNTVLTKIKDKVILPILRKFGYAKADFKTGEGLRDFIQEFSRNTRGALKSVDIKTTGTRTLKGDKMSQSASNRVQEIYDSKGVQGAFEIIEEYKPMAIKLAGNFRNVPGYTMNRDILIDEILTGHRGVYDLINEYNPQKGVPLAAYVNKYLKSRTIEAANRILDTQFTSDITEARAVTSTETAEDAIVEEEVKKIKAKAKPKTFRQKLNIGKKLEDKVRAAVKKAFGTQLPNVNDKKFKTALTKIYKTELKTPIQNLMGVREEFEKFLNKNFKTIYNALPISTLVKFERMKSPDTRIFTKVVKTNLSPTEVDQAIQDGKLPWNINRLSGPTLYEKVTPTKEEFTTHFIGDNVAPSTKGTRKDGLAEAIAEELALDATMETRQLPDIAKKVKDINELIGIEEIQNELALIGNQIGRGIDTKFSISKKPKAKIDLTKELNDVKTFKNFVKEQGYKPIDLTNKKHRELARQYISEIFPQYYPAWLMEDEGSWRFGNSRSVFGVKAIHIKAMKDKTFVESQIDKDKLTRFKYTNKGDARGELTLKNTYKVDGKVLTLKQFVKTQEFKDSQKEKLKALEEFVNQTQELLTAHPEALPYVALFFETATNSQTHILRKFYPFKFFPKDVNIKVREEHNPPQHLLSKLFLESAWNEDSKKVFNDIKPIIGQSALSIKDDGKLNYGIGVDGKVYSFKQKFVPGITLSDLIDNPLLGYLRLFNEDVSNNENGINPNAYELVDGNTLAELFKVNVDSKLESPEVQQKQLQLIGRVLRGAITEQQAKKYIKIFAENNSKSMTAANKKNVGVFPDKLSRSQPVDKQMEILATYDKAAELGRSLKTPKKGISVFDFDNVLAKTNSKVLYTLSDGKKGKLSATEFAIKSKALEDAGAVFEFSEFSKIVEGKKGPLADLALKRQGKFGSKDIFIVTARPQASDVAIQTFLKGIGLEIPLQNITGLEDGTPTAKANWVAGKAAKGYNDFYFADDVWGNVKAVKDVLNQIDVKSKVQHVKFSKSKNLNDEMSLIIEKKTGISKYAQYSPARAKTVGATKGKWNFWIPYSAEDFVGLIYPLLGKGKEGDSQMAWFKKNLLDPFNRAEATITQDRISVANDFKALKKNYKTIPKTLKKEAVDGFTYEQALRVYIWNQQGETVPGLSQRDVKQLTKFIEDDAELNSFANGLVAIQKGKPYPAPDKTWLAGNLTTDIIGGINKINRAQYLQEWQENIDIIFSKENMSKLEAAYGAKYVEALKNTLSRMSKGTNKLETGNRVVNNVLNWVNNSVGAIMFLNTRSAVLQTISAINYMNWTDNNPLKAGIAFANQKQFWTDFVKLMNSDYLKTRRKGLQINVTESEIADAASGPQGINGVISLLLKKGFILTQFADSFAIASGGATFYRNRINTYLKDGLSKKEAEEKAYLDWYAISEESQQSSRTDRISMEQASAAGRVILAFANTPMQYARLQKKAFLDLKNKRGDWKTNMSKIAYYGVVQNFIFNAVQQALFSMLFDEEEEELSDDRAIRLGNGMMDSILRGLGIGGAAISTAKNILVKIYQESGKKRPKYEEATWEMLDFSPPISSKITKMRSALRTISWDAKEIKEKGFSLDNPAYLAGGQVLSATTNIPLDRVIKKGNNIADAVGEDAEMWQRVALLLGWSMWELEQGNRLKIKKKSNNKKGKEEITTW